MSSLERDPNKRRVKPVETQASILDFDLEGESSDDSDFRIEDHPEVSDDYDSENSNQGDKISSDGDTEESDSDELKALNNVKSNGLSISDVIQQANSQLKGFSEKDVQQISICCGCLGDQSDGINEIVECDSCGVTVHEACYGISDSASLASTDSLSPTAPWFCDTCKAGVKDPICELCPNSGGIFKETDVGKWIHLVCALYVPGVAFGEVDKLTGVTLFEMPYSKWGAKSCSLCPDERFARTGVCIGCDAGMCKTYFHVTCAQREGFLSEAHSEEVDQADPFYAHCRMHSDKTLVKRRKRNYLALQLRTHYRRVQFEQEGHSETPEQLRIQRKLEKQRVHFLGHKALKPPPWVPTQKMPRLLTTSASACRKLLRKAELMGINTTVLEMQEAHAAALVDVRKKWHIPPAFTVEFIAYYLDRNDRLKGMKETLERLLDGNRRLLDEQQSLRVRYDELLKTNTEETKKNVDLKQTIHKFHSAILSACPTKNLPNIEDLGKPALTSSGATVSAAQTMMMARTKAHQPMMVPTAAALKMGVGFPLNNMIQGGGRGDRILSSQAVVKPESLMLNECGICRQKRDQHLLAKCDTCHLYYHLDCLNPPLTRLPKKSKLYGWQCSECDKSSDSEMEEVKTPRRSKSRYSREARLSKEGAAAAAAAAASKVLDSSAATTPGGATASTGTPKLKIKAPGHGDEEEGEEDEADVSRIGGSSQRSMPRRDSSLSSSNKMEISSEINGHPPSSGTPMDLNEGENNSASMMMGHIMSSSSKSGKKRRREKHKNRYSPELTSSSREHKRKRKKKSIDLDADEQPMIVHPRITIKIKPIPLPEGEVASESNPQCFYVPSEDNDNLPPTVTVKVIPPPLSNTAPADITNASNKTASTSSSAAAITGSSSGGGGASIAMERRNMSPKVSLGAKVTLRGSTGSGSGGGGTSTSGGTLTGVCDVCKTDSFTANSVKCDDCQKNYHFTCLDPPVKKSPKRRGYSWHCADCDPTGSE